MTKYNNADMEYFVSSSDDAEALARAQELAAKSGNRLPTIIETSAGFVKLFADVGIPLKERLTLMREAGRNMRERMTANDALVAASKTTTEEQSG